MASSDILDQQIAKALPRIRLRDVCSPFRFNGIQKIFFFLLIGLGSFWILSISMDSSEPLGTLQDTPANTATPSTATASTATALKKIKLIPAQTKTLLPQEELLTLFRSRHLFIGVEPPPPPPPKQDVIKPPGISEKIKALTLSGVLQEEPMQAMIEVKGSGESYCLKAGESVLDMEIVSIAPGQVTLKYQDESAVLR